MARAPLGVDPQTGQHVYVLHGRFGAYVQLGRDARQVGQGRREAEAGVAHAPA